MIAEVLYQEILQESITRTRVSQPGPDSHVRTVRFHGGSEEEVHTDDSIDRTAKELVSEAVEAALDVLSAQSPDQSPSSVGPADTRE